MKKFFKKISEFLFGKKDALSEPCLNVYKRLEEVKQEYISDEEFNSLSIEQQKAVLEKEISDAEYKMNVIFGKEAPLTGTSIDYETGEPLVRERPIVTSGYLRREDDPFPEPGILTTSTSDKSSPKITFFSPEDNKKEIKLNEKKSSEIKKKRGPYKKKKK